jgi:hypothetical protein
MCWVFIIDWWYGDFWKRLGWLISEGSSLWFLCRGSYTGAGDAVDMVVVRVVGRVLTGHGGRKNV